MTTDTETPTTEEVIYGMLVQNTGTNFLDSGGAYGRNYERNGGKTLADFQAEPRVAVDFHFGLELTQSVFHFLCATVDYDAEFDAIFQSYLDLPENESEGYLVLMEEFPTWLAENHGDEFGLRPSGHTVNTYNGEDSLSQVIQYHRFSMDNADAVYGEFVLLQVHGGCDVRGGYTRPVAFTTDDYDTDLYDNARLAAGCSGVKTNDVAFPGMEHGTTYHGWDSDNGGYSWSGCNGEQNLDEFEVVAVDSKEEIVKGQISTLDGEAHCPVCTGVLHFDAY